MIRHRPYGSGHPYATTEDQRVPAWPMDGEAVELRVRASAKVVSVVCEWATDGASADLPLTRSSATAEDAAQDASPDEGPDSTPDAAKTVDGGHLAGAQARAARAAAGSWVVRSPVLRAGHRYAYRFRAALDGGGSRTSRWFEVTAATWGRTGGKLVVRGADRVVPGSVRWLVGGDGARRVRFELALAGGEHVVGFGERFDAAGPARAAARRGRVRAVQGPGGARQDLPADAVRARGRRGGELGVPRRDVPADLVRRRRVRPRTGWSWRRR